MNRLLLSSLQLRLILGIAALFIAGTWGFAAFIAHHQAERLEAMLLTQLDGTADYVATNLEQNFHRRINLLTQLTTQLPADMVEMPGHLGEMVAQRPMLKSMFGGGIVVIKPDTAGASAAHKRSDGKAEQRFDHSDAIDRVIRDGRPAVSMPFVGPDPKQPLVGFAVPVRDAQGRLTAVLAGVSAIDAADFLGGIQKHGYGKTGDFVVVAPQYGVSVTGTDPAFTMRKLPPPGVNRMLDRMRRGEEGSGVTVDSLGITRLVAVRRLPTTGWFIAARLPADEAFAPVVELRRIAFGGAAILSLLVAALATLWVRRALAQLTRATAQLDAMNRGEAAPQALEVTRQDEVGRLLDSFNRLQERFSVAFRASPIAASIARVDDGRFLEVNEKWQHDFGWKRDELIGRNSVEVGVWMDDATRQDWIRALRREGHLADHAVRWRRRDGAVRDVSISAEIITLAGEDCVLAYVADITARREAERALAESEERNRRMIETANEGIWIIDPDSRVSFVNQRMADMLGYGRDEILGHSAEDFLYAEDLEDHRRHLAARREGGSGGYERRFRCKDGRELWTQVSGTAIMNPDGSYGGAFGMFTDISHLKQQQYELQRIAHFDALTGLPNRVLLADRMQQAIAQTRRAGRIMAVCYLDLDGFKPVNDTWGHEAGDRLLVEISGRLRDCVRAGDTVARLGGDEFVLLLLGLEQKDEVDIALSRMLEVVARAAQVDGSSVSISASIGVTTFPADDATPDTLLRHADQAMYAAKQRGKNRWQLFDPFRG